MAEENLPPLPAVGSPAKTSQLSTYLLRVIPALLETNDEEAPEVVGVTLKTVLKDNESKLKRFIEDSQESSLSIFYSLSPTAAVQQQPASFEVHLGVGYWPQRNAGVILTKCSGIVEGDKSFFSQLRLMTVSAEDSPFETLHSYMQDAIKNSVVQRRSCEESEVDKPFHENTSELQQSIGIPEITLQIHPVILEAVAKATQQKRRPVAQDVGDNLSDAIFLSDLQQQVAAWTVEIKKVTIMERDVSSGTASQEIDFWFSMEHALTRLCTKLDSPEIVLTLDVLKAGKCYHAVTSFNLDTEIKATIDKVMDYTLLMKDFPIEDLLSADTFTTLSSAIAKIFRHFKKLRHTNYPTNRTVSFVEAISRDLLLQFFEVLSAHKLMDIAYWDFDEIMKSSIVVFTCWEDEFERFHILLRECAKKRDELTKYYFMFNLAHRKLHTRLLELKKFRYHHEQLKAAISTILKLAQRARVSQQQGPATLEIANGVDKGVWDEGTAAKEVHLAYENVKDAVDVLDLSIDGSAAWDTAVERYEKKIDKVEAHLTAHLRNQLGSACNANEMFRVFFRCNALFVRPNIRTAVCIREYQTQLIQEVKKDIDKLHKKFKTKYSQSPTYALCCMRDIPPTSSYIIWARQIEHQLDKLLERVEAVLGVDWYRHVDGQELKKDGEYFKEKLNPTPVFESWKKKVESRLHVQLPQGCIFDVIGQRRKSGSYLRLVVKFNDDAMSLYKEVRNLRGMSFRIPFSISSIANQANLLYPLAIHLRESIRAYELTCKKIDDNEDIRPLVAGLKIDVQEFIKEGFHLKWDSYQLESFVHKFSDCVLNFQEMVDEALHHTEQIHTLVGSLATCEYRSEKFAEILDEVQERLDYLNLCSYTNLKRWVNQLDEKVEGVLMGRLSVAITDWKDCLINSHDNTCMDATTVADSNHFSSPGGMPEIESISHEFHVTNQIIDLEPPLELSRCHLIAELHKWISTIIGLQRIQSSRYEFGIEGKDPINETYRLLLGKMMESNSKPLVDAYGAIEGLLEQADSYVEEWLRYQSLWDMEFSHITAKVGENLELWQRLLQDIEKARRTNDTTESIRKFGPVVIQCGMVKSEVNLKYDSWHKEILNRHGTLIGTS